MKELIGYASLAAGVLAAGCGVRAALVKVRDDVDQFIGDIQRQSRWATYTAVLAALSALGQAVEKVIWP